MTTSSKAIPIAETAVPATQLSDYTTELTCVQRATGAAYTPITRGPLNQTGTVGPLTNGDDVVCTFTNTNAAPTLKLVKDVRNSDGGTATADSWTLTANAAGTEQDARNISTPGGSDTPSDVFANVAYALAESPLPNTGGYSSTGEWACTGTGFTLNAAKNAVTMSLGGAAECTIINTDNAPTLKLVKDVRNSDGGTATADSWTLTANAAGTEQDARNISTPGGSDTPSDVFANVAYALAESPLPNTGGYSSTGEWACTGTGFTLNAAKNAVTMSLGGAAECTIINTDNAPTLKLVKDVRNTDGGTATADSWTLTANAAGTEQDARNISTRAARTPRPTCSPTSPTPWRRARCRTPAVTAAPVSGPAPEPGSP